MLRLRGWLVLGIVLHSVSYGKAAQAQQPQPPSRSAPAPGAKPATVPGTVPGTVPPGPDDGFIEFLGSDDVGDAAWWEFLKKSPPRGIKPPAPPPQDAKQ